ncbi:M20 family metallopeptidase [Halorubrum sp. RMP-47]|uniref:M20 family metallopeptidase n=1 Tax=Halorubrum miltondacostae TaxID=3076378 RepID=UPI00352808B9
MTFDREEFHRKAITTPSHDGVSTMRALLVETLVGAGHTPDIDEVGNVIATRDTGTAGPHLVLNTHLDTVSPHLPYERDGDVVRGRGSCDAKGPLAALTDAFCETSIKRGKLTLAVSPDEETSQFGGERLAEMLSPDGVIVGEPTGLDVCVAARGSFGGHVTLTGESAHASDPESGRNAISEVGPLVEALARFDEECGPDSHETLGPPVLSPTKIQGGGPLNQIPAECTVSFDRRSVPPETSTGFFETLPRFLEEELSPEYGVKVEPAYPESPDPEAFVTERDAILVQTLAEFSGRDIRAFGAATEASYFAPNAPTVVFGPGELSDADGPVAHSDREYVRLSDLKAAADAVRATVESLLS